MAPIFHAKRHAGEMDAPEITIRHFLSWLAADGKVGTSIENRTPRH